MRKNIGKFFKAFAYQATYLARGFKLEWRDINAGYARTVGKYPFTLMLGTMVFSIILFILAIATALWVLFIPLAFVWAMCMAATNVIFSPVYDDVMLYRPALDADTPAEEQTVR